MNPTEAIRWLNWFIQNDDRVEFFEEDGGLIMVLTEHRGTMPKRVHTIVGTDLLDCVEQATVEIPCSPEFEVEE